VNQDPQEALYSVRREFINGSLARPTIMTVKEIAEYLKLTPTTIYKLARSGEIPAAKVASEWRFVKHLVDDWLIERACGTRHARRNHLNFEG